MTGTESTAVQRLDINPADLLVDRNIRLDTRLDSDFVASVKDHGVLIPIIAVRTTDGALRVRFGHRRTAAAIQAGLDTVPVDVIGDEGSDDAAEIERVITQHVENAQRTDLSVRDELNVVEQLSA
jgi:ParB/RepB/Spo0J family partition protein